MLLSQIAIVRYKVTESDCYCKVDKASVEWTSGLWCAHVNVCVCVCVYVLGGEVYV